MLCLLDANRPCVPLCALVWQGSWLPHLLFGSALKLISGEMPERERERERLHRPALHSFANHCDCDAINQGRGGAGLLFLKNASTSPAHKSLPPLPAAAS